jgi:hypothetical protein
MHERAGSHSRTADKGVASKIAGTFNSLVKLGDFSNRERPAPENDNDSEEEDREEEDDEREDIEKRTSR